MWGGLLGIAAVYALRRAFLGPLLTLRSMQARMNPTARLASERVDQQPGFVRRIGVALAGGPLGRLIEERLGKSLRLAGFTVPFVVGQVVTSTLVALFATGMVALALMSAGVVGSSPLLWPASSPFGEEEGFGLLFWAASLPGESTPAT